VGYNWNNSLFVDRVLPMGLRTLLSVESFFVTVFKGEIFKLQLKGFFSNGPIIASYEASLYKCLMLSLLEIRGKVKVRWNLFI
jgi:hypothetical protein